MISKELMRLIGFLSFSLFPSETLAMKGLTLNCLGKKEEAYELVRRAYATTSRVTSVSSCCAEKRHFNQPANTEMH